MMSNGIRHGRINDTEDDETSKLLQTIPPGISARTHSISGTKSTVLERPEVYKSRWRSIRVMYLTMFLSSVSFSICMSSLYPYLKIRPEVYKSRWRSIRVMYLTMFLSSVSFSICVSSLYPYLKILDKSATTNFLGWVVAAYSVGQLIASPISGAWSNLRGKSREPLIITITINILANVLYMYLESIHTQPKIFLILARSNLDKSATTNFLGWVVAAYSVGQLIASPIFGAWSTLRGKSREPLIITITINILANVLYMYLESIHTQPKIFLIVARALVGFGAGNVAVVRSYVSGATTLDERTSAMANMSACQAIGFIIGPLIQTALVPIGYPGIVHVPALHLDLYTSTAFLSALVGVLNVVLLVLVFREHTVRDDMFTEDSTRSRSIEVPAAATDDYRQLDYLAVISSIVLFFSVLFVFAIFETIATPLCMHMFSWTKAQATLYVGVMLGVAGIVSILVFVVIKILSKRFNERYLLLGGFIMCMVGFFVYLPWGNHYPDIQYAQIDGGNATAGNHTHEQEATGCPYYYSWCFDTPAVRMWQFVVGTFFIAVGYPTCNVMSYTIYSKILGPKPQGTWMGWLTAAGSLARTLGPLFVSNVYDAAGPRVTFSAILGVIFVTVIGFLIVFRRLVPFSMTRTIVVNDGS